ncbi:hypothetical protein GX408_09390 [bacterium]|nr:hypothetical protein [bacterium]
MNVTRCIERMMIAVFGLLIINGCGDKKSPTEPQDEITGTVSDVDGNNYRTVKIGTQWWMAENLKVKHYRNGEAIPIISDSAAWKNLTTGACCSYNNGINTFGLLYNWFATADSRKIAPEGWHVPSRLEWDTMAEFLGGSSVAGGKMKEMGTLNWKSPNAGATNVSGFNALPYGNRGNGYSHWDYCNFGTHANFWSLTEFPNNNKWGYFCAMEFSTPELIFYQLDKKMGFSIRCVKD